MNKLFLAVAATLAAVASPALADTVIETGSAGSSTRELPPYLQCVPYARQVSGINIFGDAHTWWNQAAGRYERGHQPKVGAVMAFRPQGNMRLGHVAAVSKIIDKRTVLLRHANWSPIGGRRGQIENDVRAIDVSPDNDWSEVRVWYAPIQDLGGTAWPVEGFIYNDRPGQVGQIAAETPRRASTTVTAKRRADVVGDIIAQSS
jgi:surface antigen